MRLCNLIWDFDGTLLDTYPHSTTAFFEIMRPYGFNEDFETVMAQLHRSFNSVRTLYNLSDAQFDAFLEHAYDLWFEPVPTVYPGAREVLSAVCAAGGNNFLYTHRNKTAIDYLEAFDLLPFFRACVTNEQPEFDYKPAGTVVRRLVEQYQLDPAQTAMIGDREMDVLAGQAGGCRGILFDPLRQSDKTAADQIIGALSELLPLLS